MEFGLKVVSIFSRVLDLDDCQRLSKIVQDCRKLPKIVHAVLSRNDTIRFWSRRSWSSERKLVLSANLKDTLFSSAASLSRKAVSLLRFAFLSTLTFNSYVNVNIFILFSVFPFSYIFTILRISSRTQHTHTPAYVPKYTITIYFLSRI